VLNFQNHSKKIQCIFLQGTSILAFCNVDIYNLTYHHQNCEKLYLQMLKQNKIEQNVEIVNFIALKILDGIYCTKKSY